MENQNPESNKKKRSKRFSQVETDQLLSLVLSSNVNSMETNRMTTKGRSVGWESICIAFNASPGVVQRTEKELRERTGNIRKDLYKLAKFQRESVLATGGGCLPPHKPPTISFELTEIVKKYALSLQVKLAGLASFDSDRIPSPLENVPEVSVCEVADEVEPHVPSPRTFSPSPLTAPQMFPTQTQRSRKRKVSKTESQANSTSRSTASAYYEEKIKLIADENKRRKEEHQRRKEEHMHRNEWHKRCVQIKDQELTLRKKQTEFWSLVTRNYAQNPANISEIASLANIANTMESTNYSIRDDIDILPPSSSGFQASQCLNVEAEEIVNEDEEVFLDYESLHSSSSPSIINVDTEDNSQSSQPQN